MSIANVRIHVKRTLKRVKVWHIFNQVVPLSMHGFINRTNLINRHPLSFELTTTSTLLYFVTDLLEFLICWNHPWEQNLEEMKSYYWKLHSLLHLLWTKALDFRLTRKSRRIFPPFTFQSQFYFLCLHQEYLLVFNFPLLNCKSKRFRSPCVLFQSSQEIWRALRPCSHATSGLRRKCVSG